MVSGSSSSSISNRGEAEFIKQDGKFFTRIMSKDVSSTATPNSSFRVYYGGASGAIPFTWESAPGTPKHTFSDSSIPPLTPPPSFNSHSQYSKSNHKLSARKLPNCLFRAILFPRPSTPRSYCSSVSSTASNSWSFSSSSSSSGRSTPFAFAAAANSDDEYRKGRPSFSCSRPTIHHGNVEVDDEEDRDENEEERKDLKRRSWVGFGGWYSSGRMRNALFSIVGGGKRRMSQ